MCISTPPTEVIVGVGVAVGTGVAHTVTTTICGVGVGGIGVGVGVGVAPIITALTGEVATKIRNTAATTTVKVFFNNA